MTISDASRVCVLVTFTVIGLAACVPVAPMPVTVRWKVPSGAVDAAATVIVATPAPVIDAGVTVTVVPAGAPAALRSTRPAKPPCAPTATENCALAPGAIAVVPAGVTATLKSGRNSP